MGFLEFEKTDVLDVIRRVSRESSLTIVVGAGASAESGLPNWRELVTRLLKAAAAAEGVSDDEALEEFASWTMERENVTSAGGIARELLGKKGFREELRRALYRDQPEPIPGETARCIARLALDRSSDERAIVTTNYDDMLRRALLDELEATQQTDRKVRRIAHADDRAEAGELAITHLHGVLTPGDQVVGELVLSDRDYHLMQDASAWQEKLLGEHLENRSCFFVGTSLTDPNLLRYIFRSRPTREHFAVFTRQQDADLYDASSDEAKLLREESQKRKWRSVGVTPILVDYYSQSAQILWEILASSVLGQSYEPLPLRLTRWREELDDTILSRASGVFVENQNELHRLVRDALEKTLSVIRKGKHRRSPGEKLGMSLWVYDPGDDSITNWASADRVWRDPETLEPVRIDWASDFVATKAFCSGSMVSQSTSMYKASRWNHVIGFPIYVHADAGRLPVGSVTLASTNRKEKSMLERASDQVRLAIPELEDLMTRLIEPIGFGAGK